jgi:hypothetical protein
MKALLIFHLRAGVRVAVRSFAILFSAMLFCVMLNVDPAGMVRGMARSIYARNPSSSSLIFLATLAFLLPALAAPRLAHGLNGWIRHLPFHSAANRRGMAATLLMVQTPLAAALALLAVVAHRLGLPVLRPSLTCIAILAAGAVGALPVTRRYLLFSPTLGFALLAIRSKLLLMMFAVPWLVAAEAISGPLRAPHRKKNWRPTKFLFHFTIAWRALGWRTPAILAVALLPIAAAALFVKNNDLPHAAANGAVRMGGIMAATLALAGLANKLAERRPIWPMARSFPWSAARRIAIDTAFLALHAALPVLVIAPQYPISALHDLAALPFLAFRASEYIRRVPRRLAGARPFLGEGACIGALVALLPWMSLVVLAGATPTFLSARRKERAIKATCWDDLHHAPAGDSLSWSE